MMNRYQQTMMNQKPKPKRKKQIRLSISFKEDELWIYEKLRKYSCPSAWIKDLLKEYLKEE